MREGAMDTYYLYTKDLAVGYDGRALIENIEIGVRRGEILTSSPLLPLHSSRDCHPR